MTKEAYIPKKQIWKWDEKKGKSWWGNRIGKWEMCLEAVKGIQQEMMRVILKAFQKELPRMH